MPTKLKTQENPCCPHPREEFPSSSNITSHPRKCRSQPRIVNTENSAPRNVYRHGESFQNLGNRARAGCAASRERVACDCGAGDVDLECHEGFECHYACSRVYCCGFRRLLFFSGVKKLVTDEEIRGVGLPSLGLWRQSCSSAGKIQGIASESYGRRALSSSTSSPFC